MWPPVSLQSLRSKEGDVAETHVNPPSVPPSAPSAAQRPRSSSPIQKPHDSPPPAPLPLLPPAASHTESEAESLLEELQLSKQKAGLAGEPRDLTVHFHTRSWMNKVRMSPWHCLCSCRSGGSCAAAASESDRRCRGGWSFIRQCLCPQSLHPVLRPPLLLLSGPPQPGEAQPDSPHRCYAQVNKLESEASPPSASLSGSC